MRSVSKYLISVWGEFLVVILFLFFSNNFLDKRNDLIQADGRGYYEYLPATFIYKDLQLDYLDTLQTEFYDHKLMSEDFYPRLENGKRFDKYFVGTAVLQVPFFLIGHIWASYSDHVADGFSRPYQISIYFAAVFYTFFGLLFLRKLLITYYVNRFWILVAQMGVIVCTSMLNYMHWDAAYSHVYSFFLIAGFLYFSRNFLLINNKKSLFWAIVFFGLIFLVRPVNVIVILFIPILAESTKQLVHSIKSLFREHLPVTIISLITIVLIYQIQCVCWYFQTGHWFYYSYGEEKFIWSDPMIIDFLFSYRKGFFLWAPWLFVLICCAILFHVFHRMWFRLISFFLAFSLLIYVLSSWWSWSYGGSIGSRPMIDFYPVLIVFAAPIFTRRKSILKWIILLTIPIFGYVAVTQVYQYQKFILVYDGMDKAGYWKVFLKKDYEYQFYLWQTKIETGQLASELVWDKHRKMDADRWYILDTLQIEKPTEKEFKVGQITFRSPKKGNNETLEIRLLDLNDSLLFNQYTYTLHVIDEPKGEHFIDYRFNIPLTLPSKFKTVFVINTKESPMTIDSMKIRFFTD